MQHTGLSTAQCSVSNWLNLFLYFGLGYKAMQQSVYISWPEPLPDRCPSSRQVFRIFRTFHVQVLKATGSEDAKYPHPFELRVKVEVGYKSLTQELAVTNTGKMQCEPFLLVP
eukprot:GHRR01021750.1.p1 GENE.GHRR01021750.1~~GHRR01021750.1.p1  ORF type:complete len:113 (-),score=20.14 GHRR01021750.1:439-777(-)